MKAVVQRVLRASVAINTEVVGAIGHGYVLLVGVEHGDDSAQASRLADKVLGLRLFANAQGKLDYDIGHVQGLSLIHI